ncbi:hypothetical protein Acsp03_36000 [Actinomadura sp. NBRC 104412]|uniref:hypothetical protein n=1 Tax=Actinomadura sp. NBRC 104412 TaxID=3032203 RepID=UPI0024A0C4CB|nr:hypothetical protein [Actinomadura sp. NBRC 104412]GLZ06134.1 hypothetical protein Acsp03_36000 [Actinomadura sp. NBRC 104412]
MADRAFTVVVCGAVPCSPPETIGDLLLPRLAEVVRRTPHGVLVRGGCLLGAPRCLFQGRSEAFRDSGTYLAVQPCDTDRRPCGKAIRVGPVLARDDAEAVASWLADGDLDADRLTPRLRPARL